MTEEYNTLVALKDIQRGLLRIEKLLKTRLPDPTKMRGALRATFEDLDPKKQFPKEEKKKDG